MSDKTYPKQGQSQERLSFFLNEPKKGMWKLAFPVMMGMGAQTVYNITDMIFVGRISADAISALAFNIPLVFFAMGIAFALGNGVTAVIAQFFGAEDLEKATRTAEHGLLLSFIIGFGFSAIGLLFSRQIFGILRVPETILPLATEYFSILAGGICITIFNAFLRSIFNGEGNTKTPMVVQVVAMVANIILDAVYIFVFDWGIAGAAWATVTSQLIVFITLFYLMLIRRKTLIQIKLQGFHFEMDILKKILNIGVPAALSMIIMSTSSAIFNTILVSYSEKAVAAYQIGMRLDHIFFLPTMSIANALLTLVGMYYGAKRADLIKSIVIYGIGYGMGIAAVCTAVFFTFATSIFKVFTDDLMIQSVSISYIRVISLMYPFIALGMISSRVLQAFNEGVLALILTLIRVVLISTPLALYFSLVLNKPIEWVWYAMSASTLISAFFAVHWMKQKIQSIKLSTKVV